MGNESSRNLHYDTHHQSNKNRDSALDRTISTLESTRISRIESITPSNKSPISPTMPTSFKSHSLRLPCVDDSAPMPPTLSNRSLSCLTRSQTKSKSNKKSKHHRRQSSLIQVHNGITGKFISSRICKIAAKFWQSEIEILSVSEQLEIGCSIFFSMLSSNNNMKTVMKQNFNENKKIEHTSLRYLDMMGWLIRYLMSDNIDLYQLLLRLGRLHQQMGINIQHFPPMLDAMHETFAYYFEKKYSVEIQYALDEIFTLAAQLMTGQSIKFSHQLMDINSQFQGGDIPFLANLDACLKSNVGKQYLHRYLSQTWCDEMTIFLKSLARFKQMVSDKERFMVAREITKASIEPAATFALNLSYDTRQNALYEMKQLENMFNEKKSFKVDVDFYSQIEKEINKLIMDNHWMRFCKGIEELRSKSANVE